MQVIVIGFFVALEDGGKVGFCDQGTVAWQLHGGTVNMYALSGLRGQQSLKQMYPDRSFGCCTSCEIVANCGLVASTHLKNRHVAGVWVGCLLACRVGGEKFRGVIVRVTHGGVPNSYPMLLSDSGS